MILKTGPMSAKELIFRKSLENGIPRIRCRKNNPLDLIIDPFKLDRTAFKAQTLHEASDHRRYYKNLTWQERLKVAAYLNSVAFNFDMNNPPRMDKTKFSVKSFSS